MAVNVVGGPLEFDAVINNTLFKKQIDEMYLKINGFTGQVRDQAKEIDNLGKKVSAALAAYFSITTAGNFIKDIVRVRGEFQQLEVAFKTMLGSKEKADKLMAEAIHLAAITPFSLNEVATGAKQLLAYGFAAEDTTKNLTTLGNIAAGVSAPLGDIVYLYGTLRAQGRAYAVDIRQFAGRGIPIYEELAKVLGVAQNEVLGLVEAGKVGFPEVEKAFKNLTSEGGKFFNLMEEQSKTLTGLVARLGDAWQVMLNDIGKDNEGVFNSALRGAISLVENYQDVLDVLKIIAVTYGTYKAAIIATTVAQNIATAATKGYTVAETLRYQAMLISDRTMKILNATMLSNPWVAAATGIAAVVAALIVFNKEASNAKSKADLISESQEKIKSKYEDQEVALRSLVVQLKNSNTTEGERLRLYGEIRKIDPSIIDGIDQKAKSFDQLDSNVSKYIENLRLLYKVEANEEAIKASIQQENAIQALIDKQEEADRNRKKLAQGSSVQQGVLYAGQSQLVDEQQAAVRKQLIEDLQAQKKTTEDLTSATVELQKTNNDSNKTSERTVKIIEEEIAAEKERQKANSTTSKQYQESQKKIEALQKELEGITGKKVSKDFKKFESDFKNFIDALQKAENEAKRSGLAKEESEIDKINEQYDELLAKAKELGVSTGYIQRIQLARDTQVGNTKIKQEVESYIEGVKNKREAFEKMEDATREYGIESAKSMYKEQTESFNSYIAYLRAEMEKAKNIPGKEGLFKTEELGKIIAQAEKDALLKQQEADRKTFSEALNRSITFNSERLKLEEEYQKQKKAIEDNYKGDDKEERLAALKQQHEEELSEVDSAALRQKEVYKLMNEDILKFTEQSLRDRVKKIKSILKNDKTLTPQMRADVEAYLKQIEELLVKGGKVARISLTIGSTMGKVGAYMAAAANATREWNAKLSEAFQEMSEIAGMADQASLAIANFSAGKITEGIIGSIGVIGTILSMGAKNKQERVRQQEEIQAFQKKIYEGEFAINELYRQRALEQVKINKLRIDGLRAEKDLLQRQTSEIQAELDKVLSELQTKQFELGFKQVVTARGVEQVMQFGSLAGKTLKEIEELSLRGQLPQDAEALFQIVKKLNEELDAAKGRTEDNIREMQELLTGTTADSITDSIVEGFENGNYAVEDFAGNFENLMRQAILRSLRAKALEGPLQKFYEQFAADAESEGMLTESEIAKLETTYNTIIENAAKQFENLKKITDVSFQQTENVNSLQGGIKASITEETGTVIAGNSTAHLLTARQTLDVATRQLNVLNQIESNTAKLVQIQRDISDLKIQGIKIKS